MMSIDRLSPAIGARPPNARVASAMSRTVSNSSSVSHMDLQIKQHWNDAVDPSTLISRTASPMPFVSDEDLQSAFDDLETAPSSLTAQQKSAHLARLKTLNIGDLPQEQKSELYTALNRPSRETRRKGIVEYIRNNEGVVRWATSLRSLVESKIGSG